MKLKRRLIVVVNKSADDPVKSAMDCFANVNGLSHMGTLITPSGIMVKLAHENFPPVPEPNDPGAGKYCACILDVRDDDLVYHHYPLWSEMQRQYRFPSVLDEDEMEENA